MTLETLIKPQYRDSRIILPGDPSFHLPKSAGNVVVHAPFAQDYETEIRMLQEERQRDLIIRDLRQDKADAVSAAEAILRSRLPAIMGAAAGAWTFTNGGRTSLLNGTFDIDSDTWKMALFLSTSNIGAGSTTYAGLTNEHANANGYTTGGIAITLTLAGTTTVTVDISTDPVWTASGGPITARFAVIYEVSGNVLCYCLLDSTPADVTATDGNTLTVAAHASGVFTLA